MKWFKYLICIACTLGMMSCHQEESSQAYNNLEEVIESSPTTVHQLVFEGNDPVMLRTEPTHLYGVQVYYRPENQDIDYQPYAHGLFNQLDQLQIRLLDDYEYHFVSTLIIDGTELVAHDAETQTYWNPFITQIATPLSNTFNYSSEIEMKGLSHSQTMMRNEENHNKLYDCPAVDRYYGELAHYTPCPGHIAITYHRVSFDANFIVEGDTPSQFNVYLQGAPILSNSTHHGTLHHIQGCFTYPEDATNSQAWMSEDYKYLLSTTLKWKDAEGEIQHCQRTIEYSKNSDNLVDTYIP